MSKNCFMEPGIIPCHNVLKQVIWDIVLHFKMHSNGASQYSFEIQNVNYVKSLRRSS
jgi:hypothetical protein